MATTYFSHVNSLGGGSTRFYVMVKKLDGTADTFFNPTSGHWETGLSWANKKIALVEGSTPEEAGCYSMTLLGLSTDGDPGLLRFFVVDTTSSGTVPSRTAYVFEAYVVDGAIIRLDGSVAGTQKSENLSADILAALQDIGLPAWSRMPASSQPSVIDILSLLWARFAGNKVKSASGAETIYNTAGTPATVRQITTAASDDSVEVDRMRDA